MYIVITIIFSAFLYGNPKQFSDFSNYKIKVMYMALLLYGVLFKR